MSDLSQIRIMMQLCHINESLEALNALGINPWAMNEGMATGEEWYEMSLADAHKWGLIWQP